MIKKIIVYNNQLIATPTAVKHESECLLHGGITRDGIKSNICN